MSGIDWSSSSSLTPAQKKQRARFYNKRKKDKAYLNETVFGDGEPKQDDDTDSIGVVDEFLRTGVIFLSDLGLIELSGA